MKFDSVVFADSAPIAALSCFSRLKAARSDGRKALIITLVDSAGAEAIRARGLGEVTLAADLDRHTARAGVFEPWRERVSVIIRRLGARHVMAPLGLCKAPQAIDYFGTFRAANSIDQGRDLLFFEERPHCFLPESVSLRLSGMGARLPPATRLRPPRRYAPFVLLMISGFGIPSIFGRLIERSRLARSLKTAFREVADWDPQRALGPRLQPVIQSWTDEDTVELLALASDLGLASTFGPRKTFDRRMARHAASAESPTPIERYWLCLPGPSGSDLLGT